MMNRAFTLLELLCVVATIAVLAAIAVPNFLEAQVRAKISRTHQDAASMRLALANYRADFGEYPPNILFDRIGTPTEGVMYKNINIEELFNDPAMQGLTEGIREVLAQYTDDGYRIPHYYPYEWQGVQEAAPELPRKYLWPSHLESDPLDEPKDDEPNEGDDSEFDFSQGPPDGMDPMQWEMMMIYGGDFSDVDYEEEEDYTDYKAAYPDYLKHNSILSLAALLEAPRDAGYLAGALKRDVFQPAPAMLQYVRLTPTVSLGAPVHRDEFTTTTVNRILPVILDSLNPRQPYLIFGAGPDQEVFTSNRHRSPWDTPTKPEKLQFYSYDPTNGTISGGDLIYGEHGRILSLY